MTAHSLDVARSGAPRGLPPASPGLATLVVGALCTLTSFAAMSWLSVTGPQVITSVDQLPALASGSVLLVNPNAGTSHSGIMWAVVVGSILAATAAQLPRIRARGLWLGLTVALAAIGLLDTIARAAISRLAVGKSELPAGTSVRLHPGIWFAMAGLMLVAVSVLLPSFTKVDASAA